jgi:hypothetical protein
MKTYRFVNKAGATVATFTGPEDLVAAHVPEGCDAVEADGPYTFEPQPPTDAELAAIVRGERARRLRFSDWTQMADITTTSASRNAWRAYRQALRDITEQPGFPHEVTWPTPPDTAG